MTQNIELPEGYTYEIDPDLKEVKMFKDGEFIGNVEIWSGIYDNAYVPVMRKDGKRLVSKKSFDYPNQLEQALEEAINVYEGKSEVYTTRLSSVLEKINNSDIPHTSFKGYNLHPEDDKEECEKVSKYTTEKEFDELYHKCKKGQASFLDYKSRKEINKEIENMGNETKLSGILSKIKSSKNIEVSEKSDKTYDILMDGVTEYSDMTFEEVSRFAKEVWLELNAPDFDTIEEINKAMSDLAWEVIPH